MSNWLWNGNDVTEDVIPEGAVGFIYMIEHIPTGKYYIGKKSLESVRNVKIGVRELQRIREERKLAGIRGSLPKRSVLQFCYSKKSLSYYEVHHQFKYNVLSDDNSLNGNILGKFYRKDLDK